MQIGMVGLGRMGGNIARRLMRHGHDCVVYDAKPAAVDELANDGATGVRSLEDFVRRLDPPRVVWLMLPAGKITEATIAQLAALMQARDIIIDGGNSFYRDDIRRARELAAKGISYVDVGTSGGIWGLERGYCMMIGGEAVAVQHLDPILAALAPGTGDIARTPGRQSGGTAERGYIHCGPAGAGHFVKMIHNGIEYGLMEAYAEGFEILEQAASEARAPDERYRLNVADIAEVWRRGSVISSWLLDLTAIALSEDPELAGYSGRVADSGEGRWTLMAAIEAGVPADVLSAALYARFRSRDEARFGNKLLSAMRNKFGGHIEPKSG
jgi:6-phosphogluconate dehydrogenase